MASLLISDRLAATPDDEVMRLYAAMQVAKEHRIIEELKALPPGDRKAKFRELAKEVRERLEFNWRLWAREKQLAPDGDWSLWIIRAGRGFGKTRAGSGWVHERAMEYPGRWIALVARNPADARDYMIEGPGGLLRNTAPNERPEFEPSKRRLTWPNGSWATIYSDEEPDQLRGFSGDTAWLDEFAKFKKAREGWDNLQFGMREASTDRPRRLITTTPRPIPLLRELEALSTTHVVTGTSHENRANLDPTWYEETIVGYEKTRLGRQEVYAEILDDFPGALWTREMLDSTRVDEAPEMARVIVAVDPSGTKGEAEDRANDVGIVVVGIGMDGRGYVLADRTCNLSPEGWGRRVIDTFYEFEADRVVAETNFGGAMVRALIHSIDQNVPYAEVKASRGKVQRAEPVAALYESGRISHVGVLPELEDQMMLLTSSGFAGEGSADRVDSLVWGLTDIMLNSKPIFATAVPEFKMVPFKVPDFWPKGFAMMVEPGVTSVLWGAYDKDQDILYVTTEHVRANAEPSINAQAIAARGKWIPGILDSDEARVEARQEMAAVYWAHELNVVIADRAYGAGVQDVAQRIASGRLKAFGTCERFFREYRSHRRDEDGRVIGRGLMDCVRILARPTTILAMKPKPTVIQPAILGYGRPAPGHVGDRRAGY